MTILICTLVYLFNPIKTVEKTVHPQFCDVISGGPWKMPTGILIVVLANQIENICKNLTKFFSSRIHLTYLVTRVPWHPTPTTPTSPPNTWTSAGVSWTRVSQWRRWKLYDCTEKISRKAEKHSEGKMWRKAIGNNAFEEKQEGQDVDFNNPLISQFPSHQNGFLRVFCPIA